MPIYFGDTLHSSNVGAYSIVKAEEVGGHKTVADLSGLYNLSDAVLSSSKTNSNNDAIGQLVYVVSEDKFYQLTDWNNRKNINGWKEFSSGTNIVASESELDNDAPNGSLTVVINPKPKLYIKGSDAWEEYYETIPNASTAEKGLVQINPDSGINIINGVISVLFDTVEYDSEDINNPEFEFSKKAVASPDIVKKIFDAYNQNFKDTLGDVEKARLNLYNAIYGTDYTETSQIPND